MDVETGRKGGGEEEEEVEGKKRLGKKDEDRFTGGKPVGKQVNQKQTNKRNLKMPCKREQEGSYGQKKIKFIIRRYFLFYFGGNTNYFMSKEHIAKMLPRLSPFYALVDRAGFFPTNTE